MYLKRKGYRSKFISLILSENDLWFWEEGFYLPNFDVVPEVEEVESVKEVEEPLEEPIEVIRILLRNIHRKSPKVSKAVKPPYEVDIIKIKPENVHHNKDPPIPKLFLHKNVPQNTQYQWCKKVHMDHFPQVPQVDQGSTPQ